MFEHDYSNETCQNDEIQPMLWSKEVGMLEAKIERKKGRIKHLKKKKKKLYHEEKKTRKKIKAKIKALKRDIRMAYSRIEQLEKMLYDRDMKIAIMKLERKSSEKVHELENTIDMLKVGQTYHGKVCEMLLAESIPGFVKKYGNSNVIDADYKVL